MFIKYRDGKMKVLRAKLFYTKDTHINKINMFLEKHNIKRTYIVADNVSSKIMVEYYEDIKGPVTVDIKEIK